MERIRILIVDDQRLFVDSLRVVLDLEEDMEVVSTCRNGEEAIKRVGEYLPDLVLMDIRMPQMDGVECTRRLKEEYPDIKIVMLTTFDYDEYVVEALLGGASGYLLKDIDGDRLLENIREVHRGNFIMPDTIASKVFSRLKPETGENVEEIGRLLTPRELEIAQLMVEGCTNGEIACTLFLTEGTVKNYISEIYSKIGIRDRTQAVVYLKEKGL